MDTDNPHAECERKIAELTARLLMEGPKSDYGVDVFAIDQHGQRYHVSVRDVYFATKRGERTRVVIQMPAGLMIP